MSSINFHITHLTTELASYQEFLSVLDAETLRKKGAEIFQLKEWLSVTLVTYHALVFINYSMWTSSCDRRGAFPWDAMV